MGYKVDIAEVIAFSNEFFSTTIRLIDGLELMKSNINRFVQMDSFTGKTAEAAKQYFEQLHFTITEAFQELFAELQINFDHHLDYFQSYVDSSSTAKIDNDHLYEIDEKIANTYIELKQISVEINRILTNISDISYVRPASFSSVNETKFNATQTVIQLQQRFLAFTDYGRGDNDKVNEMMSQIETTLNKLTATSPDSRFSEFGKNGKDLTGLVRKAYLSWRISLSIKTYIKMVQSYFQLRLN